MPTAPSPGTARALDTFVKLRRAVNAIGARLNPALLKEHRLTETQFGVLEALYHKGPMAQARLCEKLLVSGSNLTTVVDNLERHGWVRRLADPDDRRAHRVELTPTGRQIISRAFPGHADPHHRGAPASHPGRASRVGPAMPQAGARRGRQRLRTSTWFQEDIWLTLHRAFTTSPRSREIPSAISISTRGSSGCGW